MRWRPHHVPGDSRRRRQSSSRVTLAPNCSPVVVVRCGAGRQVGPVRCLRSLVTVAPLDPGAVVCHGGHGGQHADVLDVGRVALFAPAALNHVGQFAGGHAASPAGTRMAASLARCWSVSAGVPAAILRTRSSACCSGPRGGRSRWPAATARGSGVAGGGVRAYPGSLRAESPSPCGTVDSYAQPVRQPLLTTDSSGYVKAGCACCRCPAGRRPGRRRLARAGLAGCGPAGR